MSRPEEPTEEDKRLLDMEVDEPGNKGSMPAAKTKPDEQPPSPHRRSRSRSPPRNSLPAPTNTNNNNNK